MDFLTEMLYALTSAYSHRDYDNRRLGLPVETLIGKLFSVLAWGLNDVQKQAELIRLWDDIDHARGSVLDRYGANFGVKRFGADDRFYRLAIKVKLLAQLSGGDINTVLDAAASLLEIPVERIGLKELYPAKIGLDIQEADLSPETLEIISDIMALVKRILAAGVGLIPTLYSYREYRRSVSIQTSLFDRTNTVFDLPDVRPVFSRNVPVATALFDRSSLVFDLPDVKRIFSQKTQVTPAAFEHTGLAFNLPDARRTLTRAAPIECVLFEHSALRSEPAAPPPQVAVGIRSVAVAVFECSQIFLRPVN